MDEREEKLIAALEKYVELRETEAAWYAERQIQRKAMMSRFQDGMEHTMSKVAELRHYGELKGKQSKAAQARVDELAATMVSKSVRLEACLARRAAAIERILVMVEGDK